MTSLGVCFEFWQNQLKLRIRRRDTPPTRWVHNGWMRYCRLLAIVLLAAGSTKAATVSGTALDAMGAVIPNAHVVFHWDPSGSNQLKDITGDSRGDVSVKTGEDGRFSVELKPGFYDVFVAAMGFSPHCEKVRVKDKEVRMTVTLDVSPIVTREAGDSVVLD